MGFLDSIFGMEKSELSSPAKGKSDNPFSISLKFLPLRLSANTSSSINVIARIKNLSPDTQLVSVDGLLPRSGMLGFDKPCINKHVEKRVGEIKPGKEAEVSIPIWGNSQTKEGTYELELTVFSHYIGYDKVLAYMKKKVPFRVV